MYSKFTEGKYWISYLWHARTYLYSLGTGLAFAWKGTQTHTVPISCPAGHPYLYESATRKVKRDNLSISPKGFASYISYQVNCL